MLGPPPLLLSGLRPLPFPVQVTSLPLCSCVRSPTPRTKWYCTSTALRHPDLRAWHQDETFTDHFLHVTLQLPILVGKLHDAGRQSHGHPEGQEAGGAQAGAQGAQSQGRK